MIYKSVGMFNISNHYYFKNNLFEARVDIRRLYVQKMSTKFGHLNRGTFTRPGAMSFQIVVK